MLLALMGMCCRADNAGVTSFVLRFDEPLTWYEFSDGLALLLQVYGARILRIKGLLNAPLHPLPVLCV